MSTEDSKPPVRGGHWYDVDCLRVGADARTATALDFFVVRVRAPNSLSARLAVRNDERYGCGEAFFARKVCGGRP